MRVLTDLSQKPMRGQRLRTVVIDRDEGGVRPDPGKPLGSKIEGKRMPTARWNAMSFPERVATTPPVVEVRAAGGRRQHQIPRNDRRMYRPQDQRGVSTVFVILDRETDQVLARVRGGAAHCEVEAEKLACSQGCELADLKVVFEGELA